MLTNRRNLFLTALGVARLASGANFQAMADPSGINVLPPQIPADDTTYSLLAMHVGDYLFPDYAAYATDKKSYPSTLDELSSLINSDREPDRIHPVSGFLYEYIQMAIQTLLIDERDWERISTNQQFRSEFTQSMRDWYASQQIPFDESMSSARLDKLGHAQIKKQEIYENVRYVDEWIAQWNTAFYELSRKRFFANVSDESLLAYGDLNAVALCEAIEHKVLQSGKERDVSKRPLYNYENRLYKYADDPVAAKLIREINIYTESYENFLLGNMFKDRTLGLDQVEKCPYWEKLDEQERLHHMLEIIFYKKTDFMSGVFVEDPTILAHFAVDLALGRAQFAGGDNDALLTSLKIIVDSSKDQRFVKLALTQMCTDEPGIDCSQVLPFTAARVIPLHERIQAVVEEKLARLVIDGDPSEDILLKMVQYGILNSHNGKIAISARSDTIRDKVVSFLEQSLFGANSENRVAVIEQNGQYVLMLPDGAKLKPPMLRELLSSPEASTVPAVPTVPQSAPHSAPHPSADCR